MSVLSETETSHGKGRFLYGLIKGILIIGVPLQIFPFVWMVTNSFKSNDEIMRLPPTFWPENWKFEAYAETFKQLDLWNNIYNTIVICLGIIVIQITVSAFAAYSLSKLKPKGGNFILLLFLGTMMISAQALMFPLYLMMSDMPLVHVSLINSKWSYILASSAWAYSIFLFKGFFDNLPSELLESARIDGASNLRIFGSTILPLSGSIFAVLIISTFMAVYNDFVMPMMLLPNEANWPLMVRVYAAQASSSVSMSSMYVLLAVTTLPMIVIYLIAQRRITEGISMTGLKG